MTGGKTFTVNDIDEGHMLEDAFHGALTYQPPPPRSNTTVTVRSHTVLLMPYVDMLYVHAVPHHYFIYPIC